MKEKKKERIIANEEFRIEEKMYRKRKKNKMNETRKRYHFFFL